MRVRFPSPALCLLAQVRTSARWPGAETSVLLAVRQRLHALGQRVAWRAGMTRQVPCRCRAAASPGHIGAVLHRVRAGQPLPGRWQPVHAVRLTGPALGEHLPVARYGRQARTARSRFPAIPLGRIARQCAPHREAGSAPTRQDAEHTVSHRKEPTRTQREPRPRGRVQSGRKLRPAGTHSTWEPTSWAA